MIQQNNPNPKLLLIEDDITLVKMYTTKFTSEGFEFLTAQDGNTGLKMALEQKPKLILIDMMIPGLSGNQVLEKLRADEWGKTVPVLMLTNLSQQEETKKAMELGAKEYLIKANFTPKQVVEKVRHYL